MLNTLASSFLARPTVSSVLPESITIISSLICFAATMQSLILPDSFFAMIITDIFSIGSRSVLKGLVFYLERRFMLANHLCQVLIVTLQQFFLKVGRIWF